MKSTHVLDEYDIRMCIANQFNVDPSSVEIKLNDHIFKEDPVKEVKSISAVVKVDDANVTDRSRIRAAFAERRKS